MFSYLFVGHPIYNISAGPVYSRLDANTLTQHNDTNDIYNALNIECDIIPKDQRLLLHVKNHIEKQKSMTIEESSWTKVVAINKRHKKEKWIFTPYKKTKKGQNLFLQNLSEPLRAHIGNYAGFNIQDQYIHAFNDCTNYEPGRLALECTDKEGFKHFLNKNSIPRDIVHLIVLRGAQDSLDYVIEKKINLNVPLKNSSFYFSSDMGSGSTSSSLHEYEYKLFGQDYIDQTSLFQMSHTPLDIARFYAMSRIIRPEDRIRYYQMCGTLEQAGAQSSIELKPMESIQMMQQEYDQAPHLSWTVHECSIMVPRQRRCCCAIS